MVIDNPETNLREYVRMQFERIEETQITTGRQVQEIHETLVGSALHPNGLVTRVQTLEAEMDELRTEWRQFKAMALGVVIGAGVVGGGVGAGLMQVLGG